MIDRDERATVYQLLPVSDVAWHAAAVNRGSIGIEHVGIPGKLMCTEEQYRSSALLVAWLCHTLKIPCDRKHVLTHNEASPGDGHVLCCTGSVGPGPGGGDGGGADDGGAWLIRKRSGRLSSGCWTR